MEQPPLVVALGHAIVDVIATCDDDLLQTLGLSKGTMELIDPSRAESLYDAVEPEAEASGGSAANTAAAMASLGQPVRFIGKVADDRLGKAFSSDIRDIGVDFDVPPASSGPDHPGTGRCLVFVTPDAERTMCTSLGIAESLQPSDIDPAQVAGARLLYIEGYLCKEATLPAVRAAIDAARQHDVQVALSASDPAWVELMGPVLRELLDRVDVLLANEAEALGLSGASDVDGALEWLTDHCPTVAITLGSQGCLVTGPGVAPIRIPAAPVGQVVDTNGAGDAFAAGFLHGLVTGRGLEPSARLGAVCAAEVVGHLGARPLADLAEVAQHAGLL